MSKAMTAPRSLRSDPEIDVEERSFTFAGDTYIVRAKRGENAWEVAAYRDDERASRLFELPYDGGEETPSGVVALLNELMVQAESDVRKEGRHE